MTTAARTHTIGPANGTLLLHTSRTGLGSKAGHDLTIEVTDWSGTVTMADNPADSALDVTIEMGSLKVVSGSGGIKPLSERDKGEIVATAAKVLGVKDSPQARFTSTSVTVANAGVVIDGTLNLRGSQRPLRLEVTPEGDDRFRATCTVVQTHHGIKPYSGFFGALKLHDHVTVEADVDLSK